MGNMHGQTANEWTDGQSKPTMWPTGLLRWPNNNNSSFSLKTGKYNNGMIQIHRTYRDML